MRRGRFLSRFRRHQSRHFRIRHPVNIVRSRETQSIIHTPIVPHPPDTNLIQQILTQTSLSLPTATAENFQKITIGVYEGA